MSTESHSSSNASAFGDLEHFAPGDVDGTLTRAWRARGPLYRVNSLALILDYAGVAFSRLHPIAGTVMESELDMSPAAKVSLRATLTLSSYIRLGYETGIRNQIILLREYGMTKEQCMELVLFTQLYAGMRGLGHVYRAVGDFLPAIGPPEASLELPSNWNVDPEAFKSGLDLSTREVTAADRAALEAWYEQNIGYFPDSVRFGLKYQPEFTKVNRAKWEVAIKTLPKQYAPHLMLRQNMLSGCPEGVREAALLAKSWGMTRAEVVMVISSSVMYFTGFEGYYMADKAIDDVLENWG